MNEFMLPLVGEIPELFACDCNSMLLNELVASIAILIPATLRFS